MRKIIRMLALCLALSLPCRALAVSATGYTFSPGATEDELSIIQDAYTPLGLFAALSLKSPQDMDVMNDVLYVADTGNKRVVALNLQEGTLRIIGEGLLRSPYGVAADAAGRVYVTDYQAGCAYRFSADGTLEMTYERPDSTAYASTSEFKPMKIAPIGDGGVYMVVDGSTSGIVQMNADGRFAGYFASNDVHISLYYRIRRLTVTKEQLAWFNLGETAAYGNIAMGGDGMVYAMRNGTGVDLQKLNYGGKNLFASLSGFYRIDNPADLCMAPDGSLFVIDQQGWISQYSRDGVLLYRFGGKMGSEMVTGLFQTPSGIGVDTQGNVYVLDKALNQIVAFQPTAYQRESQRGLESYYAGDYDQTIDIMSRVLNYHAGSEYAHRYLGKAYMHAGNYGQALEQFRLARDQKDYSDAYWEVRNQWLAGNGVWIIAGIALLALAWRLCRRLRGHRRAPYDSYTDSVRLSSQWQGLRPHYLWRAVTHPIDTAYEIKQRHMGGAGAAMVLFLAAFAAVTARLLGAGFLFSYSAEEFPILTYTAVFAAALALFCVSNFFITSINDGDGTLGMITSVLAYALVPLALGLPVLTLVYNALTYDEATVAHLLSAALYLFTAVNLSVMLMELHRYTLRQYLRSMILTVLLMILITLVASLIYLLGRQIVDFVRQIVLEVSIRVG